MKFLENGCIQYPPNTIYLVGNSFKPLQPITVYLSEDILKSEQVVIENADSITILEVKERKCRILVKKDVYDVEGWVEQTHLDYAQKTTEQLIEEHELKNKFGSVRFGS